MEESASKRRRLDALSHQHQHQHQQGASAMLFGQDSASTTSSVLQSLALGDRAVAANILESELLRRRQNILQQQQQQQQQQQHQGLTNNGLLGTTLTAGTGATAVDLAARLRQVNNALTGGGVQAATNAFSGSGANSSLTGIGSLTGAANSLSGLSAASLLSGGAASSSALSAATSRPPTNNSLPGTASALAGANALASLQQQQQQGQPTLSGLGGLSREQLLALLRPQGTATGTAYLNTASVPPLPSTANKATVGCSATTLGTKALFTTTAASSGSASNSEGASYLLALAKQQLEQQQQKPQTLPITVTPTAALTSPAGGGMSHEAKLLRLQRLQELANLGASGATTTPAAAAGASSSATSGTAAVTTTNPSLGFSATALPTRFNNSNIGSIDALMKARLAEMLQKKKPAEAATLTAPATTPAAGIPATTAAAPAVAAAAATTTAAAPTTGVPTRSTRKRKPALLYMPCDDEDLSEYQTLVRKQIEAFEADTEDTSTSARGRNRPIVSGQVGIRCRHCKVVPPQHRQRAAIYYPSKLDRLYQMSQTIASVHLAEYCQHIPPEVRRELARLREAKSAALGGKKYWADSGRVMGLIESDKRLFYGSHKDNDNSNNDSEQQQQQ